MCSYIMTLIFVLVPTGPAVIKPAEIKTFQRQTQNIPPAMVELRAADRPGGSGGKGMDRAGGRPVGHHHPPARLLGSQPGKSVLLSLCIESVCLLICSYIISDDLKGQCNEIFRSQFFHRSSGVNVSDTVKLLILQFFNRML
jgi:hypothetical protein